MQKKSHLEILNVSDVKMGLHQCSQRLDIFSSEKYPDLFRYSSPDKYNILLLKSFSKEQFKLNDGGTLGAKAVANRK